MSERPVKIDGKIDAEITKLRDTSDQLSSVLELVRGKQEHIDNAVSSLEAARKIRIPPIL